MRAMKSVLIVTRMGYIEGVFTSFRALAKIPGSPSKSTLKVSTSLTLRLN